MVFQSKGNSALGFAKRSGTVPVGISPVRSESQFSRVGSEDRLRSSAQTSVVLQLRRSVHRERTLGAGGAIDRIQSADAPIVAAAPRQVVGFRVSVVDCSPFRVPRGFSIRFGVGDNTQSLIAFTGAA